MNNAVLFTDPNQVKMLVESISNERGLPVEMIFVAMEGALAAVLKKQINEEANVVVKINRQSGSFACSRIFKVVADDHLELTPEQIVLSSAKKIDAEAKIDSEVIEPVSLEQCRVSAHQSGQMILKFVREAERQKLAETYARRVGDLFTGQVKRVTRDNIIVDLGERVDACLSRKDILPREIFRVGDRIKAFLTAVDLENKGPVLILSRTEDNMLIELFKLEVPEIQEGVLEIKAVARDPGVRSKIAVKSKDARVDIIGSCVGMRGARVQAVSSELNNERIDIIIWDENPAKMIISAMAPAEIQSVIIDENDNSMDVIVDEEELSQAIGRGGQNVKLASKLVGWSLNVMSQKDFDKKQAEAPINTLSELCNSLDVDEQLANILIRDGYESLDSIVDAGVDKIAKIEEFDEGIASEIIERANSGLLEEIMAISGDGECQTPSDELLKLSGMPKLLAHRLAANGIVSVEDLADLSIVELKHIKGLSEALSADLIMQARKVAWDERG